MLDAKETFDDHAPTFDPQALALLPKTIEFDDHPRMTLEFAEAKFDAKIETFEVHTTAFDEKTAWLLVHCVEFDDQTPALEEKYAQLLDQEPAFELHLAVLLDHAEPFDPKTEALDENEAALDAKAAAGVTAEERPLEVHEVQLDAQLAMPRPAVETLLP